MNGKDKVEAYFRLSRIYWRIESIRALDAHSPCFKEWHDDATDAIGQLDDKNIHLTGFKKIRFLPEDSTRDCTSDLDKAYRNGLGFAEVFLERMFDEVEPDLDANRDWLVAFEQNRNHLYRQEAVPAWVNLPSENIVAFCERWSVIELALFGSVLRDDFGPDSDIDILVRFRSGESPSLFDLSEMESDLAKLVRRRVDLVEREAVEKSPNYIRRRAILSSARTIYTYAK